MYRGTLAEVVLEAVVDVGVKATLAAEPDNNDSEDDAAIFSLRRHYASSPAFGLPLLAIRLKTLLYWHNNITHTASPPITLTVDGILMC